MNEMYEMSQDIHIYSVLGLIVVLIIMILVHRLTTDFKNLNKRVQVLMIFHISLTSAVVLTGTIMMASKHLSLTPANLLMIVGIFLIAALEIKRNKALAKVTKFGLMPKMSYIKLGYKYLSAEVTILIVIGLFSRVASAVSF